MEQSLRIGIPVAAQGGLIQIAFILITVIANGRGLADSAAVGIVGKIISFLFLVPLSMLSTVSALGTQCIGADKHDRARETLRYPGRRRGWHGDDDHCSVCGKADGLPAAENRGQT